MPVRDILLDDSGNRVLVGGDYGTANGAQAVKQGIWCRVGLYLGEVWYNAIFGVDYIGRILIKNPVELVVKGELSRAIASTPDVTQVIDTAYVIDGTTRAAFVSFRAASTEGIITGTVTP